MLNIKQVFRHYGDTLNDIALAIAVLRAVPVGHPSISFIVRAIVNRA